MYLLKPSHWNFRCSVLLDKLIIELSGLYIQSIPYWDFCFMNDKGAAGAHVYIDGAPSNIIRLRAQGCRTIIFTNSTNRQFSGPQADSRQEAGRLVMEAEEE